MKNKQPNPAPDAPPPDKDGTPINLKPKLKEALAFARTVVTGKMFALAAIPLLLLAVAAGLLGLARYSLTEQTLEKRADHMLSLARSAFTECKIERSDGNDGLFTFRARLDDEVVGALAAHYDDSGFAAVAWSADGELLLEQSNLPDGKKRATALAAARAAAIELSNERHGEGP